MVNHPSHESTFYACKGAVNWHYVTLQYDTDPFQFNQTYLECLEFCKYKIRGNYFKYLRDFWFEDPTDALLFKLHYG